MRTAILSTAVIAALSGTAHSQVIQWNNIAGGSWNDPGNWLPGNVPDSLLETASIALPGTYTVSFDLSVNPLGGLSILNTAATLNIDGGRSLRLSGPVVNDGLMVVNPTGVAAVTALGFDAPISLITGAGTLRLNAIGVRARITTGAGAIIDHGSNHTIEGFGLIEADMSNAGSISANSAGQTLSISNSSITNSGSMGATNTGTLDVSSCTITQTPAGMIIADAGTVLIGSTDITGGSLDTINGGSTVFDGSVSLTDVTLNGPTVLNPGLDIDAFGTLTNNGTLTINPTAAAAVTSLFIRESMSIGGTGTVVLNGLLNRSEILTDPGVTLTIPPTQLVRGYGRIMADVINNSSIDADIAGQRLDIDSCDIANNATMRATNSATLDIQTSTIDQSGGGVIEADAGNVLIGNTDIIAGSLDTINGGSTVFDGSVSLTDVTLNGPTVLNPGMDIDAFGTLTNNGTLTINPTAAAAVTSLFIKESMSIGGTGTVVLNGVLNRSEILTDPGVTLTVPPTQLVRGYGRIIADLVNNSTIDADFNGQRLDMDNCDITNNATLRATNSATLDIQTSTVDQSGGGVIEADAGTVLIGNTDITAGSLDTINGGSTVFDGSVSLTDVTLNGPTVLNPGLDIDAFGTLTNNGTLTINPTAAAAVTSLFIKEPMSIGGTGTIVLNGVLNRSEILTDPGVTLTIPPTQLVRGFGRIMADVVNNSNIDADVNGQRLDIDNCDITNNDTMRATNSATLDIKTSTIDQSGGGVIEADAGTVLIGSTDITGGTIAALNAGTVVFDGHSSIDDLTFDADASVNAGILLTARTGFVNNGELSINPTGAAAVTSLVIEDSLTVDGTGSIHLGAINVRSQIIGDPDVTLTQGPAHAITGEGRIAVALDNHGTIAPGSSVGRMEATAPIECSGSALFDAEVRANEDADEVDSTSTFHADGVLRVTYIDGYDPAAYWGATIVTADAGVTGRFDSLDAPVPADTRLTVRVRYLPTEIRIGAVCKPDINFDGQLNFFDISAFIGLYNVQDPDADISAPFGVWNFFDIATYIAQYNTGCP